MCFLKEFEERLLIMHIKYIKGCLLIKGKRLYYLPGKKKQNTDINITVPTSNSIPFDSKMMGMIFELFLWFSSSFYVDKSFMICISKIYETHGNDTKKQFITAVQKAIRLVRRLHLGIIWAKRKVKKSNCIPPDSWDAILYCNEMVSWLSENLIFQTAPSLTARAFENLISIQSHVEADYGFFLVAVAEWNLLLF